VTFSSVTVMRIAWPGGRQCACQRSQGGESASMALPLRRQCFRICRFTFASI